MWRTHFRISIQSSLVTFKLASKGERSCSAWLSPTPPPLSVHCLLPQATGYSSGETRVWCASVSATYPCKSCAPKVCHAQLPHVASLGAWDPRAAFYQSESCFDSSERFTGPIWAQIYSRIFIISLQVGKFEGSVCAYWMHVNT